MKKKYQETLDWMFRQLPMYQRQGTSAFKKDLTNIIALCDGLNNPEVDQKFIHVAGTNGKGSVSHIIAGILQSQGYSVGMYTSPHYKDFRERIKINGALIPKRRVTAFIHNNQELIERIQPSFFEITVAMALDYFANEKPDYVVMEVGLGGRLDSTNVITPLLSVITNISFDHQSMLGNTLEKIAFEKGGIIKPNIPVVVGKHQKKTDGVFIELSKKRKAPISFAEDIIKVKVKKEMTTTRSISISTSEKKIDLKTDLTGDYQLMNIATAFAAIDQLENLNEINIKAKKLIAKFPTLKSDTHFIGRWQILSDRPLTIADSAHNEDGINHLCQQIEKIEYDQLHIVLGTVNDKDVDAMLNLFPKQAKYYFCKANIPRGLDAVELQSKALKYGRQGKSYRSVKRAFAASRMSATDSDLIIIAGSIFVVAEAL